MGNSCQIITTSKALKDAAKFLKDEACIAVDLEADSMYHYKEKICLLQIAAKNIKMIVDPLAISDLSPLMPIFSDITIKKIFHGADYDVRSLFRDFNIEINNLFDTQIAGMFTGATGTGLNDMLKKNFNVTLNKKFQRKNWSIRPLPQDMLAYAIEDVIYLIDLAEILENELIRSRRLGWVMEECEILSRVRPTIAEDRPLFVKVKGAGHLTPRKLCILEALLTFRQRVARKKDRPLFKIIGNAALLKIADARPVSLRQLAKVRVLSQKQERIYGRSIITAIHTALKIPANRLPVYPKKPAPRLPRRTLDRITRLKTARDKKAKKLGIHPALLCSKSALTAIAMKKPRHSRDLETIDALKNWQKKEWGKDILTLFIKAKEK
jgi:ribonuclease D